MGAFFSCQRCVLLANTIIRMVDVRSVKKIITMTSKARRNVSLVPMERTPLPDRSLSTNAKAQKVFSQQTRILIFNVFQSAILIQALSVGWPGPGLCEKRASK